MSPVHPFRGEWPRQRGSDHGDGGGDSSEAGVDPPGRRRPLRHHRSPRGGRSTRPSLRSDRGRGDRQSPHVLIGSIEQMVDDLRGRREAFGISCITVPEYFMEARASVVDRLVGT